jgi:adenylylsulfate kinase-like enzyme
MVEAGSIELRAFTSPCRAERRMVRTLAGEQGFIEIFIDAPLDVCKERDPKGP